MCVEAAVISLAMIISYVMKNATIQCSEQLYESDIYIVLNESIIHQMYCTAVITCKINEVACV